MKASILSNDRVLEWILAVMGILFMGNVAFGVRLIADLDKTRDMMWQLRQDVTVLQAKVDNLPKCLGAKKGG